MCCASAPGYSPAIVATTWRGRSVVSSAHSTTAPRERSQPSRPARRTISTGSMSGPRAQLLEERAAQVLLDLLARLLDGHLGQARDRREVQELERLAVGLAEQQHAPDRLVARGDRDLAADAPAAPRPGGRERGRRRSGAAPRRRPPRPATAPPGRAAGSRSPRASPSPPPPARPPAPSPSPASTESTIFRWTERRRSTSGGGAAGSGRPAPAGSWAAPTDVLAPAPRSRGGPAASPHRTRRCGSGRPPRPA